MDTDKNYKDGIDSIVKMLESEWPSEAQKVAAVSAASVTLMACFPDKFNPADILNAHNLYNILNKIMNGDT